MRLKACNTLAGGSGPQAVVNRSGKSWGDGPGSTSKNRIGAVVQVRKAIAGVKDARAVIEGRRIVFRASAGLGALRTRRRWPTPLLGLVRDRELRALDSPLL